MPATNLNGNTVTNFSIESIKTFFQLFERGKTLINMFAMILRGEKVPEVIEEDLGQRELRKQMGTAPVVFERQPATAKTTATEPTKGEELKRGTLAWAQHSSEAAHQTLARRLGESGERERKQKEKAARGQFDRNRFYERLQAESESREAESRAFREQQTREFLAEQERERQRLAYRETPEAKARAEEAWRYIISFGSPHTAEEMEERREQLMAKQRVLDKQQAREFLAEQEADRKRLEYLETPEAKERARHAQLHITHTGLVERLERELGRTASVKEIEAAIRGEDQWVKARPEPEKPARFPLLQRLLKPRLL